VIGYDICNIIANITPTLRPSTQTGSKYHNVSNIISSLMKNYLQTTQSIDSFLDVLQSSLQLELNQTGTFNSSGPIGGGSRGKKIPESLDTQMMGLFTVIMVSVGAIAAMKKKNVQTAANANTASAPAVPPTASSSQQQVPAQPSSSSKTVTQPAPKQEILKTAAEEKSEFRIVDVQDDEDEDDDDDTNVRRSGTASGYQPLSNPSNAGSKQKAGAAAKKQPATSKKPEMSMANKTI
jgi:hypothetical protein